MTPRSYLMIDNSELLRRLPQLPITHENAAHYRGYFERRLLINRCQDCGHWHHPPKLLCPKCWSHKIMPTDVSGKGHVYLMIWLHQGPAAPGLDYTLPHPVVTAELMEQAHLRFSASVLGAAPTKLYIGHGVRLNWIMRGDAPWPAFELTGAKSN
jgi:uncharacterized protein